MPPPNTPLGSNPTLQPEHEHQTDIVADEETSESNASRTKHDMRQEIALRERAAMILGSWEQLSWHSHMYGEVCVAFFFFSFLNSSVSSYLLRGKKNVAVILRSLVSKHERIVFYQA